MYPGTHTKTPKGNLSREVAFRNVGKALSDSNPGDSFVPIHRSNDFRPGVPLSHNTQICEPEVRFSPHSFLCIWSGKLVSILKPTIFKTSEDSSRCVTWLSNAASFLVSVPNSVERPSVSAAFSSVGGVPLWRPFRPCNFGQVRTLSSYYC